MDCLEPELDEESLESRLRRCCRRLLLEDRAGERDLKGFGTFLCPKFLLPPMPNLIWPRPPLIDEDAADGPLKSTLSVLHKKNKNLQKPINFRVFGLKLKTRPNFLQITKINYFKTQPNLCTKTGLGIRFGPGPQNSGGYGQVVVSSGLNVNKKRRLFYIITEQVTSVRVHCPNLFPREIHPLVLS